MVRLRGHVVGSAIAAMLLPACGSEDFTDGGASSVASASTATGGAATAATGAGGSGASGGAGGGVAACASGSACVPLAPEGWAGPAALYQGSATVACGSAWKASLAGHVGEVKADHACTPCACVPTGASCTVPQLTFYSGSGCTSSAFVIPVDGSGACMDTGGSAGAYSQTSAVGNDGACATQGGTLGAPAPSWDGEALICSQPDMARSCDGGVCVAEPATPLAPGFCVYADGDVPMCPQGYPARTLVHRGVVDDRGCTACTCGQLSGASCSETFQTYSDNACATALGLLLGDATCHSMTGVQSMKFNTKSTGGSCPAGGGDPTGGVQPGQPVTVCCER